MPVILVVEKNANIKEVSVKNIKENELYIKAGFKKSDDFEVQHQWSMEVEKNAMNNDTKKVFRVFLYGKNIGKATSENKYEFPPPLDNTLLFGNCILVNKNEEGEIIDLTNKEWDFIYEELCDGFESLSDFDTDEEEEDEDDDYDSEEENDLTKEGYVKDGFIVDEEEEENEEKKYIKSKKLLRKNNVEFPSFTTTSNKHTEEFLDEEEYFV